MATAASSTARSSRRPRPRPVDPDTARVDRLLAMLGADPRRTRRGSPSSPTTPANMLLAVSVTRPSPSLCRAKPTTAAAASARTYGGDGRWAGRHWPRRRRPVAPGPGGGHDGAPRGHDGAPRGTNHTAAPRRRRWRRLPTRRPAPRRAAASRRRRPALIGDDAGRGCRHTPPDEDNRLDRDAGASALSWSPATPR